MSEILKTIYASAPTDVYLICTLEVQIPGGAPIRIVMGWDDFTLGVNGVPTFFKAGSLALTLPALDTTGNQRLSFGVANVDSTIQDMADQAIASGEPVKLIYREYRSNDLSEPCRKPYEMELVGGAIEGVNAQFQGSYFDILNMAYPRERYTTLNAPGVEYMA